MDKPIEVYIRPNDAPALTIDDNKIRLYYEGQWIDFKNGVVQVTRDEV